MKCRCGYEGASTLKVEAVLPENHNQSEHAYYVWGQTDKLIELLDSFNLVPKATMTKIFDMIEGKGK